MRTLVAGASGLIGREVATLLRQNAHYVRTLSRNPARAAVLAALADDVRVADATAPGSLNGVCDGVEVVISALGAPVSPTSRARASYLATDLAANLALLRAAQAAKVRRMVYVSVHAESSYVHTRYLRAHAEFEQALRSSGLEYGVVRPTGVFGAFVEMLPMARLGLIPLVGDGAARSNPIHERDVAACAVGVALGSYPGAEIDAGGPENLTRRQIAELAFAAVRKKPRFVETPPWMMRLSARLAGVVNPRTQDFLDFIILASSHDSLAPIHGEMKLGPYLAARAAVRS